MVLRFGIREQGVYRKQHGDDKEFPVAIIRRVHFDESGGRRNDVVASVTWKYY